MKMDVPILGEKAEEQPHQEVRGALWVNASCSQGVREGCELSGGHLRYICRAASGQPLPLSRSLSGSQLKAPGFAGGYSPQLGAWGLEGQKPSSGHVDSLVGLPTPAFACESQSL